MDEEEDPLPTEEELAEALGALTSPQPLKEGWSAAAVVKDQGATDASESLGALKDEQTACKKIVDMTAGGVTIAGVDIAATKARLVALEKAVTKATKDVPTTSVGAAQLRLKKAVYLEARTEKLKFVEKGAATAKSNFATAQALHKRMVEHWTTRLETMEEEELERQESFAERNSLHQLRHSQVVEQFDKEIDQAVAKAESEAAAKAAAAAQGAQPQAPAPQAPTPTPTPQVAPPLPPQVSPAPKVETPEEKENREALEAANQAFRKLEVTAVFNQSDLPDLSKVTSIDDDSKNSLALMYQWAKASSMGDAHLPFSFSETGATIQAAQGLVGIVVWKAFFSDAILTAQDVCPMQLRQVMFWQLMAHAKIPKDSQVDEAQEALEAAQKKWRPVKKLMLRSKPYSK